MGWNRILTASVPAVGVALLATAAIAQPIDRHNTRLSEMTYSPDEALSESVTHVAVDSTYVRPRDAAISRQDLLGLMILFSVPNKHHH